MSYAFLQFYDAQECRRYLWQKSSY